MRIKIHCPWIEVRLLSLLLLAMLVSQPAFSVNQLATDDMVVEISKSSIPPESLDAFTAALARGKPDFYIKSRRNIYPLETLDEREGNYRLRVNGRMAAGSYEVYAKTKGLNPIPVGFNFQMHSPIVIESKAPGIYEGAVIQLKGYYFSKTPRVYVTYRKNKRSAIITQACGLIITSFENKDPYANSDSRFPMDVDSGLSKLEVQLPRLKTDHPLDLRLLVKSDTGYAVVIPDNPPVQNSLFGDNPTRGQLKAYSVRQSSLPHSEVWNYLLNSLTENGGWWDKTQAGALLYTTKMWNMKYRYDLRLYTVYYYTADVKGEIVLASGLVILPGKKPTASLLSYQHGTMLKKDEAPSLSNGAELGFAVTLATTEGYVVSVPDHLGLGAAAKPQTSLVHPYNQWEPIAHSNGDMLRAIVALFKDPTFLNKEGKPPALDNRLLLTGYSEGGYITLGLHRELEKNPATYGIKGVTASAPLSGPYSLSEVMRNTLIQDVEFPEPYFAPYMLVTLNNTYGMYKLPNEYLKPPFDATLPPLIDGEHTGAEVNQAMPKIVREILNDTVLSELKLNRGKIFDNLKLNDLSDPPPAQDYNITAPVYLVHGKEDDLVPVANSERTWTFFHDLKKKQNIETKYLDTTAIMVAAHVFGVVYHRLYAPYAVGEAWQWLRNLPK